MEKDDKVCEEIIREREYQEAKQKLNKKDDYFDKDEINNLMQFLMQRQEKTIRNEVERDKV